VSAYAMIGMFGAALSLAEAHFPAAVALGTGLLSSLFGRLTGS
ncbi:MAG: hypothetical protein JWO34_2383, partial [Arthrobacter sp.]|nr:hypothetical protein [Arthrobacter sp.]